MDGQQPVSAADILYDLRLTVTTIDEPPARNRSLNAGDFVTTGTSTDVYTATRGDAIRADFGELGSVELELS